MTAMKREFLMLAHNYDPGKHDCTGWYLSEKLDGMRAFWDGGITRNLLASEVPWANTAKDARYKEQPVATGLWSRYGKVIVAPKSWLNALPAYPLDGELYAGRGKFQTVVSTVKKLVPDDWEGIQYKVFDTPPISSVLFDSQISNTNYKKVLTGCLEWYKARAGKQPVLTAFSDAYNYLYSQIDLQNKVVQVHNQVPLPLIKSEVQGIIDHCLESVTGLGGEGLMLRRPGSFWFPNRSYDLLKVKKLLDMEGTVIGYTAGEETALGSKLLGLMGSVRLRLDSGVEMSLSGFTDQEREMWMLDGSSARDHLANRPGMAVDTTICQSYQFPVGSRITLHYRELTNDLVPKEARYWRKAT